MKARGTSVVKKIKIKKKEGEVDKTDRGVFIKHFIVNALIQDQFTPSDH